MSRCSRRSQGLPDNFAGGVVAAGFHLALDELFEFWREMDVHKSSFGERLPLKVPPLSKIVNVGQRPKHLERLKT